MKKETLYNNGIELAFVKECPTIYKEEDVKQFIKEILDEIEQEIREHQECLKEDNENGVFSFGSAINNLTDLWGAIEDLIKQKAGFKELEEEITLRKKNSKTLKVLLDKYKKECMKNKESLTYRGLLGWLSDNGLEIGYFEGLDIGLLTFNNTLFDLIEKDLK